MLGIFSRSCAQPQPRVFVQEAHRGVEGRAAPHFQAEQFRRAPRHRVGHGQHVIGAHARGEQRLMRVAEGGVGDQQPLLFQRPFREFFRAQFQQQLARARRRRLLVVVGRRRRRRQRRPRRVTFGLRIAVDDDVAEERQQLGGAVAARL